MYELFILGKLMHRPMHGYLLQSIVNAAMGPFRQMSWGTLYPLLRRLEQAGWLAVQSGDSSDGRGVKNYRTTPAGRARFRHLIRKTGDYDSGYRDLFRVKLSNFGHLGKKDRRLILADYRAYLAGIAAHSEAMAKEVLNAAGLAERERPYVLKAIDHQAHLAKCELAWVDSLTAKGEESGHKKEQKACVVSRPAGNRRGRTGVRSRPAPRQ